MKIELPESAIDRLQSALEAHDPTLLELLEPVASMVAFAVHEGRSYWPKQRNAQQAIENICCGFHVVAKQLQHRRQGRNALDIRDEYDVQDLLGALLALEFTDVRREEWGPSLAGATARCDFLLKPEQIVVEVKMTRAGLGAKELGEQLIVDIARYSTHADCKTLIFFVYDPEDRIKNKCGIENDLNRPHGSINVRVIISPKGV